MTNDVFEIEGSLDKDNNITYAELKKCNHDPHQCEMAKNILKLISSKAQPTSIKALKTYAQQVLEDAKNTENSTINGIAAFTLLNGALTIQNVNSTNNLSDSTVNGFGALCAANIAHGLISAAVDNKSVANKPLIVTNVILGIANGYFITKAIAAAASPWATGGLLALGIVQNIGNIVYRTSQPKTTVTITEFEPEK